jgi:hypothetical protein
MTKPNLPSANDDEALSAATENPLEMVNRLLTEGLIGTGASARLFGQLKGGRPVHPGTIVRWHLKGVRMADSRIIRLEGIRVAGKVMTSKAALIRFIAEQQTIHTSNPPISRTPSYRNRAAEAAAKQLEVVGA